MEKKKKEKVDMTDFDIKNYDTEELVHIMQMQDKLPLTKALIIEETQNKLDEFKENIHFQKFFFEVRKRLLEEKDKFNEQNTYAKEVYQEILSDRYTEKKIIDEQKNIIGEKRMEGNLDNLMAIQGKPVQGDMNPNKIHTIERIVNFDSHYRTILDPQATACENGDSFNTNIRLDSATNYTVNLSQPLTNVTQIKLKSAEIPLSWYIFNKPYGTNFFTLDNQHNNTKKIFDESGTGNMIVVLKDEDNNLIKDQSGNPIDVTIDMEPIYIKEGNYSSGEELITELNTSSNEYSLVFSYDEITNRVSITNNFVYSVNFFSYTEAQSIQSCTYGGGVGQKVDYNLGWLLGFRLKNYIIESGETITGEALLDILGPKYILISVDDFCNSKPNQDLLSIVSNKQNFELPKYYNKETMDCDVPSKQISYDIPFCSGGGIPDMDSSANLTQAQRYTVDQIKLAMEGKPADRYTSPNSTDVLVRIPVERDVTKSFTNISYRNEAEDGDKRIYFGPVTLYKFRIRLLNDKGLLVDLNNMDWSFSLLVKQVYQY